MAQRYIRQMNIAIVGAGNVAWHLAQALQTAGHAITLVYSRTLAHATELAQQLSDATPTQGLDFTTIAADVILIAVPDDAVKTIVQQLKVNPGTIVAHTSGALPLTVLESLPHAATGVFYPLQTFSKHTPVNVQQVPLLIEGDSEETTTSLEQLAQTISGHVVRVSSEKRKQLHLAAVFACNFTNHLLGISHELLQDAQLPVNLLQPLIQETITKAAAHHPFTVQTGPAIRHDLQVIEAHLQLLQGKPALQQVYRLLTQCIQNTTTNK